MASMQLLQLVYLHVLDFIFGRVILKYFHNGSLEVFAFRNKNPISKTKVWIPFSLDEQRGSFGV